MGTENYKKKIILFSLLAVGIIVITCIFALSGDSGKDPKGTDGSKDNLQGQEKNEERGRLMMIVSLDLDSSSLSAEDLESGEEKTFVFTGGSDIRTRNGRVISAALLKKGNIARIVSDDDGKLVSLIGSDEVWTYKNINNMIIDRELKKLEIGSSVYRYTDAVKVLNNGEFAEKESLLLDGTDMVDIYGIDNIVYLIKVTSGHGYLTLKNDEDFIGGAIRYGLGKSTAVTEGLRLVLTEGEHEIYIENKGCEASAVIKIENERETCFDLEGYGPEPVEYGEVNFKITPSGSLLYIDGVKTQLNGPVSLTLGYHEIEVELGGYTGYSGSIEVGKNGLTKSIALSPAPVEEPDDAIYENFTETVTDAPKDASNDNKETDNPDLSGYDNIDIPDSTSNAGDSENIEVIDGDRPNDSNGGKTGKTEVDIDITGDNGDFDPMEDTDGTFGEMTIYCSDETEIYIDDIYKGRITNGNLTIPKPIGTIELKLVKQGYVTKKYTLTMDAEEETAIFRFPDMTPEN